MINSILIDGTFYAEQEFQREIISREQFAAMKWVEKRGEWLASQHPEIVELYRDTTQNLTARDITQLYFSDNNSRFKVNQGAVSYALRLLIPKEELDEINKRKRIKSMEDLFPEGFGSERFKEHCRRASTIRHEKGIGVDSAAMILGRGLSPWTLEERVYVHAYYNSRVKNYTEIAEQLNEKYHSGKEVRTPKSIYDMLRYDTRRKQQNSKKEP